MGAAVGERASLGGFHIGYHYNNYYHNDNNNDNHNRSDNDCNHVQSSEGSESRAEEGDCHL